MSAVDRLFFGNYDSGNKLFLDEEESRHCKVLRKMPGDKLDVIDGKGGLMNCVLKSYSGRTVELEVIGTQLMPRQRNYRLHLFIAPTKQNERTEWMLEKAIEAGLDEISFIASEHSERTKLNLQRLERIAVSAIKQSAQYYLPKINPLTNLKDIEPDGSVFIAHCREDNSKTKLKDALLKLNHQKEISIFIGPEGDFSESEISRLTSKGAIPVSLGNTRLRTETAGVYAAMVLNALL